MRFSASAVALGLGTLGLGALAATPCLALTIQAVPPRPDVAQHLHSTTATGSGVLPGPDNLKGSFVDTARPQLGLGATASPNFGTSSFSFGPVHGTTTVTPGYYGAFSNDVRRLDSENPLSITLPRR